MHAGNDGWRSMFRVSSFIYAKCYRRLFTISSECVDVYVYGNGVAMEVVVPALTLLVGILSVVWLW